MTASPGLPEAEQATIDKGDNAWMLTSSALVLLKVLDVTMGLRVAQEEEIQGLDLSQHGEEGYIFI